MDGPERLAQVFVELADTLVEEFDLVDSLHMLTERCVELLAADAAGLMLADQRGTLQLMTSTLEQARVLELFELQIDEGRGSGRGRLDRCTGVRGHLSPSSAAVAWPPSSAYARPSGRGSCRLVPAYASLPRTRQPIIHTKCRGRP
jgi:hypothetical protein